MSGSPSGEPPDFDDTDELPSVSEVFRVPDPSPSTEAPSGPETTTPLGRDPEPVPVVDHRQADRGAAASRAPVGNGPVESVESRGARPARFAGARRRSLLWDAGWCLVAGVVLLVMVSAGRPVDVGPSWATAVTGGLTVGWAGVLAAVAAGGVSRAATALVGLVNLVIGGGGFVLGWVRADVPTLVLVLVAQVAGFGLVQVIASLRR